MPREGRAPATPTDRSSPVNTMRLLRALLPALQDSLAEWSKALASGASPQGRGFEPHSCHFVGSWRRWLRLFVPRRLLLLRQRLSPKPRHVVCPSCAALVPHPGSCCSARLRAAALRGLGASRGSPCGFGAASGSSAPSRFALLFCEAWLENGQPTDAQLAPRASGSCFGVHRPWQKQPAQPKWTHWGLNPGPPAC